MCLEDNEDTNQSKLDTIGNDMQGKNPDSIYKYIIGLPRIEISEKKNEIFN